MYAILIALLVTSCLSVPPVKNKSNTNSYIVQAVSIEALETLIDLADPSLEQCVVDYANTLLVCQHMSNGELITVLEADKFVTELDADQYEVVETTSTSASSRKRRDVPWNLDRLNTMKLDLDDSFMDNADVDVYILGTGITQDHSEFGNRVHAKSFTGSDGSDCDGSGTMFASLVGGVSMGIARKAELHAVQVLTCKGNKQEVNLYHFTQGINFIKDSISKSGFGRRSVVLVGFTMDNVEERFNKQLIRLSEIGAAGGVLVVVAAGENKQGELDACKSTPASAKGESALSGVMTIGAINDDDSVISNIGECVDVFAPGYEVPAAGKDSPTAKTTCTGSLCAAALAAGVAATHLRLNKNIDLETQKAMLINGATVTELGLPASNGKYSRTLLMAQTPRRVLHYTCGYYRNPALPECKIYTAECNMNKVSTFDGVGHVYKQADKECDFEVFTNKDASLVITSSHYDSTLGSYIVSMAGRQIELLPGPKVVVEGTDISDLITNTDGTLNIFQDEGVVEISHSVTEDQYKHPTIVVELLEHNIKLVYDCNSMLVIKLLSISQYSGQTGGLCGFYDGVGRNDYKLKDGTTLEKYSAEFHTSWQKKCTTSVEDVDEPGCQAESEAVCTRKFSTASDACFINENMYKEKEACVAEMTECCGCNKKATGWEDMCCKDSYFGKLEEIKKGCFICDTPHCKNEAVHENCVASSYETSYDYMETRTYSPKSCCYSIERDDVQECMAPKSAALMWDKPMPACSIKKCQAPDLPNGYTYVTPSKEEYECGESVKVECNDCYKVPATTLTCVSTCDDNYNNNAVWDKVVPSCVEKDCGDPGLPLVDNNKGLSGLSWITGEKNIHCGDEIQFQCDICYDMVGEDTITCTKREAWFSSNPSCKLRSCKNPKKTLTEHLVIDTPLNKCNDTIAYDCDDKCWKLHGDKSRTCKVNQADTSIGWNLPQPECKIKHCPALTDADISGEGWYVYTNDRGGVTKVDLSDLSYAEVNECGGVVKAVCDTCYFMSGSEYRGCVVDSSKAEPKWNGTNPTCEKKKCLAVVNDPNETHASQKSPRIYDGIQYYCGDQINMECDKCYEYASGDKARVCTDTSVEETYSNKAAFNGEQYKCSIKNCDALLPPANGIVVTPNTECGKTVQFKCNKCYRTIGETDLDCQDDKKWSGVPPTCELWKCPARTVPDKAEFTEYSDNCGEGIDYECNDCYYMKGEKASRCLEGGKLDMVGKWDAVAPTCHKYICPKLTAPGNGTIKINKYECSDSTVFKCDDCWTLIGEDTTTCLAGSKWSKTVATWSNAAPSCQLKTCTAPVIPANTYVVESKELYNCAETIEVLCADCYELGVKTTLRCNGDDTWSGVVPACTIIQCPMPALPQIDLKIHTVKIDTGNPIIYSKYTKEPVLLCDKTVTYECDKCYTLKGNDTITCHDDETWDPVPSCELKRCDTPVMTDHLEIKFDISKSEYPDQYFCRDKVNYQCDNECYALKGAGYQSCVPNGKEVKSMWSPEEQSYCEIKKCPAIEPIEHGSISETVTDCGTKITYSCKPCYRLIGSAERECTSSYQWSSPPPICESVCCPALPTYTEKNFYAVEDVYLTDERDLTYASYQYTYSGEKIDGCAKEHVCQEAEVVCNDCWEYKDEDGKSLPSPPSRECKHPDSGEGPGYWTNLDKVCTRKTCPQRSPVKEVNHADYTQSYMKDDINCNDKVTWACEACYENKKETEMEQNCQSNKQWSDIMPVCDLKECGELPRVDHCSFNPTSGTCGIKTQLTCDSCYCTEKCEDASNTEITSIQCKTNKAWQWRVKKPDVTIKTCAAPAKIDNAVLTTNVVDGEDYTCGRSIRYHCEECFKMREQRDCDCAELTCIGEGDTCCEGSWKGEWPQCVPMECPVLPLPEHALVVERQNGCKMTTIFECAKGYEWVDGDLERTCTTSETWTGKQPLCRIKNCTALEHPSNGQVSSLDHHYGTEVEFTCNDCYELPDSMTDDSYQNEAYDMGHRYNFLRCEWTGNWNGSVPACSKKSCGHPGVINNGALTDTGFSCGETIGYKCNDGYRAVSGSVSRSCGNDKQWSGEETVCKVVDCGEPGNNAHSTVSSEITTYKGQAKYDCDRCYSTSDETVVTCQANGRWSHPPPTCNLIQCDAKIEPINGAISLAHPTKGNTECGQVMRFNCDVGFTLKGTDSTMCKNTGEWHKYVHPTCERKCCSMPKLNNGQINNLDGSICYEDRVEYECDECYSLAGGPARRTCGASRAWSGQEPICRQNTCDTSHQLQYGTQSGSNTCGENRSYFCNAGYTLVGAKELTCLSSGKWSGDYPICKPITCDCSDLTIAKGSEIIRHTGQTDCSAWTTVSYQCDAGYEMKGSDEITCYSDGTWSENKPTCIIDKCVEPPAPRHGAVRWSSLKEGGRATYDCQLCYKMDGYKVADCSNGEWSNPAPVCTEVVCQRPGLPQFAKPMVDRQSFKCMATIFYQCIDEHKLHGDAVRVCGYDGKWNSSTPTCSNLACPALTQPKHGTITPLNTGEGTKMEFTCDKGYQIYGDVIRECYKGQWSGVDTSCKIQNCGDPGTPSYGARKGDSFEYKDVVTFTCDYGYYMSGDSDRKCQHDGTWSNIQPECVCNKCLELAEIPNGRIMETVANTWNSSVTYYCDAGYNLVGGDETRQCMASGNWSGEAPSCEKLKCGNPEIPEKGQIVRTYGALYGDTIEIRCKESNYKGVCAADGEWSFKDDIHSKCSCTMVTKYVYELVKTVTPGQCIMGYCFPETTTEKEVRVKKEVCE